MADAAAHWQQVYAKGESGERSWHRPHLERSLELITRVAGSPEAAIIDIGGGDATLVDDLLARGYTRLTVLDVAAAALAAAQQRLGAAAGQVRWIAADITTAALAAGAFDLWHDRALFHFLTGAQQRQTYARQAFRALKPGGWLILSTFAPGGPDQCSGREVRRYDAAGLQAELGPQFVLEESSSELHRTPAGAVQPFTYGLFRRASG